MTALAPDLTVAKADYNDRSDAEALVALLDAYARDPMGGGEPLAEEVREQLVPALAEQSGAFSLIARVRGKPAGLANCFMGFSTFAARPLVNIHDIAVLAEFRGQGVGRALLDAVEAEARARGACKLTLEVLSGNEPAIAAYRKAGFAQYGLDPAMGTAQFWERKLT
ncbi:GNAT family N-acetyltransferase [Tsuneonella mangrovi]|uniref:GNAT family N-acetyltransferase n=1 Tax=Tsuneonella mangrovi TaxID=1982042 RepID=UPI001F0A6E45|nr:GNAT family N-acetyltransferase [Tsuneonella mangrovi]